MTRTTPNAAAALLLLFGGIVLAAEKAGPADADVAGWVAGRVKEWQPTKDERVFDEIGWAPDIREAVRLATKHRRPVFLFTHDGHMDIGRC
jgi:hypothetical protein